MVERLARSECGDWRFAEKLNGIAMERVHDRDTLGIDVPVVTRAVAYLTQAHAIPPMGDHTDWFEMPDAVLEVARPNSGPKLKNCFEEAPVRLMGGVARRHNVLSGSLGFVAIAKSGTPLPADVAPSRTETCCPAQVGN